MTSIRARVLTLGLAIPALALAACSGPAELASGPSVDAGTNRDVEFMPIVHSSNPRGHHAMLIGAAADPQALPSAARARCAGIQICSVSGWRDPALRIRNGDFRADQAEAVVFEFSSSGGRESWRWRCDYHAADNCKEPADLDGNGIIGGHPIAPSA